MFPAEFRLRATPSGYVFLRTEQFLKDFEIAALTVDENESKVKDTSASSTLLKRYFITTIESYLAQVRWNSTIANSDDNFLVYRTTIAPLDQPAAALTDVSETPALNAWTAQPRLQA